MKKSIPLKPIDVQGAHILGQDNRTPEQVAEAKKKAQKPLAMALLGIPGGGLAVITMHQNMKGEGEFMWIANGSQIGPQQGGALDALKSLSTDGRFFWNAILLWIDSKYDGNKGFDELHVAKSREDWYAFFETKEDSVKADNS